MRLRSLGLALALFVSLPGLGTAQPIPASVITDPVPDAKFPARMQVVHIPTGGVKINGIAPSARSRMTEEAFADMMKKPDSGFDAMDPANVSPVVVWLGSSACEISGRMFETAGGELSVADGWQHGLPFNKGARYEPAEIGAVVADLIREAPKPAVVYGAN